MTRNGPEIVILKHGSIFIASDVTKMPSSNAPFHFCMTRLFFEVKTVGNNKVVVFLFKNCSDQLIEIIIPKNLKNQGWRPRICKTIAFTRITYLRIRRVRTIFETEHFFNLLLEVVYRSKTLEK